MAGWPLRWQADWMKGVAMGGVVRHERAQAMENLERASLQLCNFCSLSTRAF